MKNSIKHLWLIISLILAASLILLMSDREQRVSRVTKSPQAYPSIAVMQIASTTLLDSFVAGVVGRLGEKGYRAPDGKNIRLYNPQGDFGTANAMARDIVNSPYDMVITASTVALQVVSKANTSVKKTHVFGAVTDPYGTGVGISGPAPDQHPPYMAGVGTFQPVKSAIRIAYGMNPGLKRLGVVWNPGEQCSEACLNEARRICKELGIELVEATAANTSEVSEAARSLIAKKMDAVWIGGDTVAMASIGLIVNLAGQAGIPVFTNDPTDAQKGTLFGLGADYHTVGQYTADMAVAILEGQKPSAFRVENVIPEQLDLNRDVLASLNGAWKTTPAVQALLARQTGVPAKITLVNLVENTPLLQAVKGVEAGLAEMGLRQGTDFIMKKFCAQGDMSQLSQILDRVAMEKPDALITVTTPVLIAAVKKAFDFPLIFTVASDPKLLGLFKAGRPKNVCGIHDDPPVDQLLEMAKKFDPALTAVGIIYDASQMNALISVEKLRKAGMDQQVKILEATASTVSDLPEAARAVIQRGARAIILSADNLVTTGFPAIHKAAQAAGIPVYVTDVDLMAMGADGAVGDSYFDWGRQSGRLAAKVLAGVPPDQLPIMPTQDHSRIDPKGRELSQLAEPFKLRLEPYSETNHLPNVTSINTRSPFVGMARIIKETLPQARRVGTLFTPGEINRTCHEDRT